MRDESGTEMVEWTIVAVVFAVAAIAVWQGLDEGLGTALGNAETKIESAQ